GAVALHHAARHAEAAIAVVDRATRVVDAGPGLVVDERDVLEREVAGREADRTAARDRCIVAEYRVSHDEVLVFGEDRAAVRRLAILEGEAREQGRGARAAGAVEHEDAMAARTRQRQRLGP